MDLRLYSWYKVLFCTYFLVLPCITCFTQYRTIKLAALTATTSTKITRKVVFCLWTFTNEIRLIKTELFIVCFNIFFCFQFSVYVEMRMQRITWWMGSRFIKQWIWISHKANVFNISFKVSFSLILFPENLMHFSWDRNVPHLWSSRA